MKEKSQRLKKNKGVKNEDLTPMSPLNGRPSLPSEIHPQSLASKTAWSAAASVCSLFGRLIAQIVIARMLGPEGFGRIVYMVWLIEIGNVCSNFGLPGTLTRYLAELHGQGKKEQAHVFAQWVYLRYTGLALAGSIAVGVLFFNSSQYAGLESALPLLMLLFLTRGLQTINQADLAGQQRFDLLTRINVVATIALLAGVCIGGYFYGVAGVLFGYVTGAVFPALYSFSMLRGFSFRKKMDGALRRRVMKFAVNTWMAMVVSAFVWSRMEIFFLERYWNPHEVAMFTVGLTFAMMIRQAAQMFSGAFMSHFSELVGMENRKAIQKHYETATRLIAYAVFPLSMGGAAIMPVLLPLMFGAEFAPAVPNAMVLIAGSVLAFSHIGSSLVYAMEKSSFIAIGGFAGAVLSVTGCIVVVPIYGAWGAVWSRTIVQFSMIALGTWYITRCLHFSFPFRKLGWTFLAALLCSLAAWSIVHIWSAPFALGVAIFLGAVVYVVFMRLFKVVSAEEMRHLQNVFAKTPFKLGGLINSCLSWVVARG